ncbi:hypothetical protein HYV83_04450 [Candidatus Woesearchaeota archaeon]|nr:hypothetical protein [Candidatus Woesearchaeota archaeon]
MPKPLESRVLEILRLNHSDEEEVKAAALIAMKAHPNYHEMGELLYMELCFPDLLKELQGKPVVIGKKGFETVAVYEVPNYFKREGTKIAFGQTMTLSSSPFEEVPYHGDLGVLAPLDGSFGTAAALLSGLGKLTEHLASMVGAAIVHRDAIPHPQVSVWEQLGYERVQSTQGFPFDSHIMEKTYQPRSHTLTPQEAEIIAGLQRSMHFQLNNPARAGPVAYAFESSLEQTI